MSELTQCNYCKLQYYKARAKRRYHKLEIRQEKGWFSVYELPDWMDLPHGKEREVFHVSSMLAVSAACCC